MKILALDLATNTGICVGLAGGDPLAWSENLGRGSDDIRFGNLIKLTERLIAQHEPELVVIEAAIGGPKSSQYLVGLVACVKGVCARSGVPVEAMHLSSIRRHFLGKVLRVTDYPGMSRAAAKKAIKGEVMKRCAQLGWQVNGDDDAADAAALWEYACATKVRSHQTKPVGGLFNERR